MVASFAFLMMGDSFFSVAEATNFEEAPAPGDLSVFGADVDADVAFAPCSSFIAAPAASDGFSTFGSRSITCKFPPSTDDKCWFSFFARLDENCLVELDKRGRSSTEEHFEL
jgi:hypothetical protein